MFKEFIPYILQIKPAMGRFDLKKPNLRLKIVW